jgi:hypothetical protein
MNRLLQAFKPAELKKTLLFLLASLVLWGVFMLYTRADFFVTLANQVWTCI